MQFVSLIETVIVFIQEVIKMMKINKLSAFILAGAPVSYTHLRRKRKI